MGFSDLAITVAIFPNQIPTVTIHTITLKSQYPRNYRLWQLYENFARCYKYKVIFGLFVVCCLQGSIAINPYIDSYIDPGTEKFNLGKSSINHRLIITG
jgi:hypothetical protein